MMNPEPHAMHRWLQLLLGDWTCESLADMGPGEPPAHSRGTEHVRALGSLADLRRMQERMEQQLGIRLSITRSPNEVRSLRGIAILVHEQPGLCRKTRQAIPAAIKKSMDAQPQIAFDLLDESGLFGGA